MIEREIAGVVWHQQGHRIDVIYSEGKADHLVGSEAIAGVLAEDAGLGVTSSGIDIRRWMRASSQSPGVTKGT